MVIANDVAGSNCLATRQCQEARSLPVLHLLSSGVRDDRRVPTAQLWRYVA